MDNKKMDNLSLSQEIVQLHADVCSALADSTRIMILYALSEKGMAVNDLANQIGVSQPATSRHLKILRERGMVRSIRKGTNIEYSLADHRLIEALDLLRAVLRDRLTYRASLVSEESGDEDGE